MESNELIIRWLVNQFYRRYRNCQYFGNREDFIKKISASLIEAYKEIIRKEKNKKNHG